ncbi:hypothetical protein PV325_003065 [Microctonus aethiopoides]|nr:hypothetical protein PV325_003065 [Microctonus aethiopoides]
MIEWHRLPEKKALGLKLTIVTAQNPVIITAGKIVDLSLNNAQLTIRMNRWLLKPLGAWPLEKDSSVIEKSLAAILIIIWSFVLAFKLIPDIPLLIKVKNLSKSLKITGPLNHCIMSMIKYHSLISEQQILVDCINEIISDWRELKSKNDRNIMINNAKYGRVGTTICVLFTYSSGIFFTIIVPLVAGNIVDVNNQTIRPLPYPGYYKFFDHQQSPAYEIIFFLQCSCAYVRHTVTCATCSLAIVFGMHAYGQLEIIIGWLKDLVDEERTKEDLNRRFSMIIQKHVRTLNRICLVEIMGSTLNMCLVGYNIMAHWNQNDAMGAVAYALLLTSFVFNIFVLCYIGELLTDQCKKVGETAYMIDWYRLPERKALGLVLTIATAQNPVIMTAGKFINLSLSSFCNVIQSSGAYLNLLRTFMD